VGAPFGRDGDFAAEKDLAMRKGSGLPFPQPILDFMNPANWKPDGRWCALGGVLLLAAVGKAQVAPVRMELGRLLRFPAAEGTAWQIERSVEGGDWKPMGPPRFGRHGEVVADDFEEARAGQKFRAVSVDPAGVGDAPVTGAGWTALLARSGAAPSEVVFMSATAGFYRLDAQHARTFDYRWVKTGPQAAEAILSWSDGTHALLRMELLTKTSGRWGMEALADPAGAAAVLETSDGGLLQLVPGRVRQAVPAELPADLAGREVLLEEGGIVTSVRVGDGHRARLRLPGAAEREVDVAYERENVSRGTLRFEPMGWQILLEMNGAGMGTFLEQTPAVPQGQAPPFVPRRGVFTTPVERPPLPAGDCPPESLGGRSYVVHGSTVCTLTFKADGTGTAAKEVNGSLEVTAFTYAYARTGATSASVALTFPGVSRDLIDDYQFDFSNDCAGKFRRDSYASGGSAGVTAGTFTAGPVGGG
jgi:hypothetical protein